MKNKGFTLVEVAIVILIGGILLASAVTLLNIYTKQVQLKTTERRLDAVAHAIEQFLNINGRYPCVANMADLIDSANFGFEFTDCTTAPAAPNARAPRIVRIGAVPVRTLNLPDEYVADAWGGRFTYAVTEALARPGTYNRTEGAIFVRDSAGNEIVVDPTSGVAGVGHYTVVSHGANNSGATNTQGSGTLACTAGVLEEENCNGDAIFVNTILTATSAGANLYDDMLKFKAMTAFDDGIPAGAVMPFNLSACPDGWVGFSSGGRYIVGANGSFPVGSTGGTGAVALNDSEMGFQFSVSPNGFDPTAVPGAVPYVIDTGAASAHENMPPYIALLLCQKS